MTLSDGTIDLISGMCGGVVNVVVGLPMDTIKVKMQTFPEQNATIRKSILNILNSHQGLSQTSSSRRGMAQTHTPNAELVNRVKFVIFKGFYAGSTPSLVANVGENAILFLAYGQCQELVGRVLFPSLQSDNDSRKIAPDSTATKAIQLHPLGNALSGSMAACFSATWLCPTEHIKCRMQVETEVRRKLKSKFGDLEKYSCGSSGSAFKMTRQIVREQGIRRGLYTGYPATLLREIPGYFCFFLGYESTKHVICYLTSLPYHSLAFHHHMVCGAMAGVSFWTGIFPIDAIKSRIQIVNNNMDGGSGNKTKINKNNNLIRVGQHIFKERGVRGLYKGWSVAVLRAFPSTASLLATYELVSKKLAQL